MKRFIAYLLLGLMGLQGIGLRTQGCKCAKRPLSFILSTSSAHCGTNKVSSVCNNQRGIAGCALAQTPCCTQQSIEFKGDDKGLLTPPHSAHAKMSAAPPKGLLLAIKANVLYVKHHHSVCSYIAPYVQRKLHLIVQSFLL